jgi:tetratricopeptide (TPR) repeat protein
VSIRNGLVIAATIGILSVGFSSSALAQSAACANPKISKQIAKQMSAAQDAMKAKKWQESLNKMKEAEAVPGGKSAFDLFTMSQFRGYIYASTRQEADAARELESQLSSPCMPESKKPDALKNLVGLYTALKNYPKAIEYGNRALKASNDPDIKVAVAQAYYQSGNNKDAVRLMNEVLESSGRPKENQLLLIQAACSKAGNNACVTQVFEKLVVNYPKTEYWSNLMDALRHDENKNDVQQLNVFRLSNQVNVMKRADEFKEYAQLAIDENLACEAQSVLEQGFTKKAFVEKRDIDVNTRLLSTAKTKCVAEKAAVAAAENAANQAPTGDEFVKSGAQQLVAGNAAKAVEDIQKGITKGSLAKGDRFEAQRNDEAYILLGIAHLKNNNKPEAAKAFKQVKRDPTMTRIAKLWALNANA